MQALVQKQHSERVYEKLKRRRELLGHLLTSATEPCLRVAVPTRGLALVKPLCREAPKILVEALLDCPKVHIQELRQLHVTHEDSLQPNLRYHDVVLRGLHALYYSLLATYSGIRFHPHEKGRPVF